MPATYGSVTPRVAATATAASAAVPPRRNTARPAAVDSGVSDTTAPPKPLAVACLAGGVSASAGVAAATPAPTRSKTDNTELTRRRTASSFDEETGFLCSTPAPG